MVMLRKGMGVVGSGPCMSLGCLAVEGFGCPGKECSVVGSDDVVGVVVADDT